VILSLRFKNRKISMKFTTCVRQFFKGFGKKSPQNKTKTSFSDDLALINVSVGGVKSFKNRSKINGKRLGRGPRSVRGSKGALQYLHR